MLSVGQGYEALYSPYQLFLAGLVFSTLLLNLSNFSLYLFGLLRKTDYFRFKLMNPLLLLFYCLALLEPDRNDKAHSGDGPHKKWKTKHYGKGVGQHVAKKSECDVCLVLCGKNNYSDRYK